MPLSAPLPSRPVPVTARHPGPPPLPARALAEFLGTALLTAAVVGSGVQAAALTDDAAVRLLVNALASAAALGVLCTLFGPLSGAHLNPLITLAVRCGPPRPGPGARTPYELLAYLAAQSAGALAGVLLTHAMFARPLLAWSAAQPRPGSALLLGEAVATAGLVLLALGLARPTSPPAGPSTAPLAVSAYLATAIWFTSSSAYVNPALTLARTFTDTYTALPSGAFLPVLLAQLAGTAVALGLARALYGRR